MAAKEETVIGFEVFEASTTDDLTKQLNFWASNLPRGARVRRTQLCSRGDDIIALVNWTAPKESP